MHSKEKRALDPAQWCFVLLLIDFFFKYKCSLPSSAGLSTQLSAHGLPVFLNMTKLDCDPRGCLKGKDEVSTSEEAKKFSMTTFMQSGVTNLLRVLH